MPSGLSADSESTKARIALRRGAAALLTVALSLSCASGKPTQRLPSQTMSSEPASEPRDAPPDPVPVNSEGEAGSLDPREPIPAPADSATQTAQGRELTVVIDEGEGPESRRRTLVEAAAAERERRSKSTAEQIAVITNENLEDYAQGQMTELEPPATVEPVPTPSGDPESEVEAANPPSPQGRESSIEESTDPEAYWRGRILRARTNWASAVAEIDHLNETIAELRQRFYAEEDPYYRDSRIKPSWDRALDRLEEARAAAQEYRQEVQSILEDGRRAAALPGWLREGLDLEPSDSETPDPDGPTPPGEYKPGEPQIAPDPDGQAR